jgi:hypothetical protein
VADGSYLASGSTLNTRYSHLVGRQQSTAEPLAVTETCAQGNVYPGLDAQGNRLASGRALPAWVPCRVPPPREEQMAALPQGWRDRGAALAVEHAKPAMLLSVAAAFAGS